MLARLSGNSPQVLIDVIRYDAAPFSGEKAYCKREPRGSSGSSMLSAIDEAGDEPSDDDLRAICSVAVDSMRIATYGDWECIATMSDDLVRMVHHDRFARILLLFRPGGCEGVPREVQLPYRSEGREQGPEIDGYDPDELYMQWVKSVKDEGARPEHELSRARKRKNSLHRDGWEAVNPVEVIADLLSMARRDRKLESGSKKIIWGSDYASYLALIEPSEGYFRVINTKNKSEELPFVYHDGTPFVVGTDNDQYLRKTHYRIMGFDNG